MNFLKALPVVYLFFITALNGSLRTRLPLAHFDGAKNLDGALRTSIESMYFELDCRRLRSPSVRRELKVAV